MSTIFKEAFSPDTFKARYPDQVPKPNYSRHINNHNQNRKTAMDNTQHTPATLNDYAQRCHEANAKWWYDPVTGEKLQRNKGEMLMLIVSEISECMEGERKDLQDTHLPHRKMAEVELADTLIRIFDYAAAHGYDVDGAFREKMRYNATRYDHTHEARQAVGGKKW